MMADTVSRYLYRLTVNNQYLGITVWMVYCPLLGSTIVNRGKTSKHYRSSPSLTLLSPPILQWYQVHCTVLLVHGFFLSHLTAMVLSSSFPVFCLASCFQVPVSHLIK